MRLALYQPDIPQNLGAAIRLCACFQTPLDVIEPCGFPLTDRALKRAALDYGARADVAPHASFAAYLRDRPKGRLILIETDGETPPHRFAFAADDALMLGRETAGAAAEVYAAADAVLRIPMAAGARSLNVATAGAIALHEALRQTGGLDQFQRAR
ncbi:MAG: tRNA (cytidine(34)-2'-O)-methyltransferase [Alphaproteobacteria bacterium]|nr:tRNA (cytidine(34)-2'-O)-methyltransferase [Alphaproteobacteria bacterium]